MRQAIKTAKKMRLQRMKQEQSLFQDLLCKSNELAGNPESSPEAGKGAARKEPTPDSGRRRSLWSWFKAGDANKKVRRC